MDIAAADKEVAENLACEHCKDGCKCGANCQCAPTCSCQTCNRAGRTLDDANECPRCRANCECQTSANCQCGPECTCKQCRSNVPKSEQQRVTTEGHTFSDPQNRRNH